MKFMQKPLTPKQQLEYEKLDLASKRAERALHVAELASGKNSPRYAVAERLRDEIVAKMQRISRDIDSAEAAPKPTTVRVPTLVIRSKRSIKRPASKS
jgi:hypothetical protein